MKKCFIFITLLLGGIMNGRAQTSPSSLIVKVYEMDASKNSDCTNPITVFKSVSPTAIDLVNNPTLGIGSIPEGTYHCVMFHIDNLITLTPQTTDGVCTGGTPVVVDIFNDAANEVSVSPTGMTIRPNPNVETDPWVYFSDSSLATSNNNCFEPNLNGCACSGPCPLTPMTLSADATHTWVLNLNNRVSGSGASCALLLPPALEPTAMAVR